ncbi:MAG: metalloregulator ArsR/SmtB family transcription factor [Sporomusaceae bacterium]|nr:metalloregulator ArsR/SmtB family transcription factor [Sporomusaceae bacterium]
MDLVRILKALGDETRLRMMNLLRQEMLCVCEVEALLESSQSNASRHLAKLRDADLIRSEKKAQWVYYGINEQLLTECLFIKVLLDEDLAQHPEYAKDIEKLREVRSTLHCGILSLERDAET